MTRKHYEAAAEIVRNSGYPNENVIKAFIVFFQDDNARFDEQRFYDDCVGITGVRGGSVPPTPNQKARETANEHFRNSRKILKGIK